MRQHSGDTAGTMRKDCGDAAETVRKDYGVVTMRKYRGNNDCGEVPAKCRVKVALRHTYIRHIASGVARI